METKNSILITKWVDNSVVTIGTNYEAVTPEGSVRRWSSFEKSKISVPRPHVYSSYNAGMQSVDLLDQATNFYRISISEVNMVVDVIYPRVECLHGKCMDNP